MARWLYEGKAWSMLNQMSSGSSSALGSEQGSCGGHGYRDDFMMCKRVGDAYVLILTAVLMASGQCGLLGFPRLPRGCVTSVLSEA